MNEKLQQALNKASSFWNGRSSGQKGMIIGSVILAFTVIAVSSVLATRANMVPLYSNLSPAETGQIKATLDSRGIQSEITQQGTTILVPEQVADTLLVELAAENIPDSGNIDYSFFGQNAGFGLGQNEFDVLKVEAVQTELSKLIKSIEGINDANVMITMPEQGVFVSDTQGEASASIVINTKTGYKFDQAQINSLYHLVSKAVPNLPTDNIVIMNQFFEYFTQESSNGNYQASNLIETQLQVKKQIEEDIEKQVIQMLGLMMGRDKVMASVTANLDFTQEKSEATLVEPVDSESMEGIAISVERITESYTGGTPDASGPADFGETDTANQYVGADGSSNGDYERVEERINNDVNRIRKEIVESPYKVTDLGIQVIVEPPTADDLTSLPQERIDDIEKILTTIVKTTLADTTMTAEQVQEKVVVSVGQFNGKPEFIPTNTLPSVPTWVYIVGAAGIIFVVALLVIVLRSRRKEPIDTAASTVVEGTTIDIPDVNAEKETEGSMRRKQLEKMAKEKPEDFAKLLRSWIAED
ncbi:flagellar basal body M-ring protein FliF [Bacillus sp. HMF5848]|uniref:flagellar basal-body MS-ring/collar protein FliF n=1 Tax=Bacillus sp. HMF5848 TaxID=2495421 RepID=UPI000F7797B7|nr:flagellar basal-body MS-ring/collar protein FliF [Bacillus sp. HMF5848]RSK27025.1 flagellar basal body M-ring protein FliF [Bacillus sp. HMF5848]